MDKKIPNDSFVKLYIGLMFFLLGAHLLDKGGRILSPIANRFSYGDILFVLYLIGSYILNLNRTSKWLVVYSKRQEMFYIFLFAFSLCTGISWCVTSLLQKGYILDFFGISTRIAYYGLMSLFATKWIKKYGLNILILPFCLGIVSMFYFNFLRSALPIFTIPTEIAEKNFSGVLLPVCAIYLAISILDMPRLSNLLLFCFTFLSTLLVYSLGGIVLLILSLPAVWIMLRYYFAKPIIKYDKKVFSLFILLLIVIGLFLSPMSDTVTHRIVAKFHNIPGISKEETESAHLRWGHFISSIYITLKNPLFGVGEANWQEENDKNIDLVGKWYIQNENPHNAIAQIPSMFGIPAFIFFAICFYLVFKALYELKLLKGLKWKIFVFSVFMVFFGSANLMDSIFTTFYFYFFASIVFGIKARQLTKNGEGRNSYDK